MHTRTHTHTRAGTHTHTHTQSHTAPAPGGDGPKRRLLEEVVRQGGLEGRVALLGAVPHERAREVLIQGEVRCALCAAPWACAACYACVAR